MQTQLAPEFKGTPDGIAAEAILRKCVHCGFCTATCPTYQLLGDELDGPRGRIYLIKQVLEGAEPTRKTQQHLDRCLTCRNCESTCPSGVQYGHLVDIGRAVVDAKVPRPAGERTVRWLLKEGLPSPLFGPAMKMGQAVRGLLPAFAHVAVPPGEQRDLFFGLAQPGRLHLRRLLPGGQFLPSQVQPLLNPACLCDDVLLKRGEPFHLSRMCLHLGLQAAPGGQCRVRLAARAREQPGRGLGALRRAGARRGVARLVP